MHSYVHAFVYNIILFMVDKHDMVVWMSMFVLLMSSNDPLMMPWSFAAYILPQFNVYMFLPWIWYNDKMLDECYVDMSCHDRCMLRYVVICHDRWMIRFWDDGCNDCMLVCVWEYKYNIECAFNKVKT